jgi:thioredoxin-like negative regulator of GroEL
MFDFEVTSDENLRGRDGSVVLFHSATCAPCQRTKPLLKLIQQDMAFQIGSVDCGTLPGRGVAAVAGIRAVPTLAVIKGGTLGERWACAGATEDQLRSWLAAAGVPPKVAL